MAIMSSGVYSCSASNGNYLSGPLSFGQTLVPGGPLAPTSQGQLNVAVGGGGAGLRSAGSALQGGNLSKTWSGGDPGSPSKFISTTLSTFGSASPGT